MSALTVRAVKAATIKLNHNVRRHELTNHDIQRRVSDARQDAMAALRIISGMSYPQIAKHFERKDHTTVMHAFKRATSKRPGNVVAIVTLARKILAERKPPQ